MLVKIYYSLATLNINWDSLCGFSPTSAKFCDIIFNLNLSQLICEPTHTASNTLDLILTPIPDHIFNININIHSEPPPSYTFRPLHYVIQCADY